jgi:AcrR family transcriptional regulator
MGAFCRSTGSGKNEINTQEKWREGQGDFLIDCKVVDIDFGKAVGYYKTDRPVGFIMGNHTQQRSEETHNAILEAAGTLFAQQGYTGTGVAGICEAAGVSKGAFYHHFTTKQEVFLALLNDWLGNLNQAMQQVIDGQREVPDALMYLASLGKLLFMTGGKHISILMEFWEQSRHDPESWKAAGAPYERYQQFLARIIRKGVEEGSLRDVDPDDVAKLIIAVATGLMLQGVMDMEREAWGQTVEKYIEILIEGLRRRP